jgi:hypothetical protein
MTTGKVAAVSSNDILISLCFVTLSFVLARF